MVIVIILIIALAMVFYGAATAHRYKPTPRKYLSFINDPYKKNESSEKNE